MKIRQINKSIDEILCGATYLGQGASKEAYKKDGIVYKVPRGRYLVENLGGIATSFPDTMEEISGFLYSIYNEVPQLVWPLGQFAIELIVWNAFQELISEGLEINCIAEIKDYYFDKNGVIIIEQELASDELLDCEVYESLVSDMETELEALRPILNERYQIELCDVRGGNYGVINNKMKVFDFGLSSGSGLFDYGSYSEECDDSWEDEYESSDEYWDSDHSNY